VHILFTAHPAHGHLLPLLPLARAARRAGHTVAIATGAEGVTEACRRGFATWEIGPSRAESDAALRAALPDPGALAPEERIPAVIAAMFGASALRRAEALVERAEQWQPDMVVHPITEMAGAVAAARTGARHVVHGLGPLHPEAWDWFGSRFGELCDAWDVPELADRIAATPYLDNCPPSLQADAVAAFGNRRPLQPSPGDDLGAAARLPWSDKALAALPFERTVHVTLGTIFHGVAGVFETILAGLRELEVNVLLAVGPGADPKVLGRQPSNVLVTDYAPHNLVLPRCAALVSQGGAGTILGALAHGLPHVILPQGADQFQNSATAAKAGVAVRLVPEEATTEAIAAAVDRALDEPAIAARCRVLRAEIESMPTPDEVIVELAA
jgi:UDP:flavonoid glycosyltransferase YjiC (YdhE family)